MIYSLTCGGCLQANNVAATDEPIVWVCNDCGNENSTSLPVKLDGELITDASQAGSILPPAQAAAAKNIVQGEVID